MELEEIMTFQVTAMFELGFMTFEAEILNFVRLLLL